MLLIGCVFQLSAQDELRWKKDIIELNKRTFNFEETEEVLVITGSSSARKWTDMSDYFPNKAIINTGFGGSQMHDLLYYLDDLVLQHLPAKVFIYEGDNDIGVGKGKAEIMETTLKVVARIQGHNKHTEIYFISPKPSIKRWHLREQYLAFNQSLNEYCEGMEKVSFVDVWNPMINENGSLKEELFIEDGLHMNKKGYELWAKVLHEYVY